MMNETARRFAQTERIIERLKDGPAYNYELAHIALKYTSRISDARKLGHAIICERLGRGTTLYRLLTKVEAVAQA